MIAYASRTGNRRNLRALRSAGWRIIISARDPIRPTGFKYAIDNGAWGAYVAGEPFDEIAFVRIYDGLGDGADFVVLPDIVAGGEASLAFSMEWKNRLVPRCPYLLAVQDGMNIEEIAGIVGTNLGIFVGGTTEWKVATMEKWGEVARSTGAYLHAGRVNSAKRIALCAAAGMNSFDGSSASRFALSLPRLENARQQLDLLRYHAEPI